ncbi:MAG: hypothetical protein KGZ92_01415 [Firmicutes bacterium]|nr:hypothetical protein [Dethiobacter sp.]MBS3887945.1 hypothetical protein [Bacillota bacterium]
MQFTLNAAQSVAAVLAFLLIGYALQRHIPLLKNNYVPAPFLGGVALYLAMALTRPILDITLDSSLVVIFSTAFFASIGLRINRALLAQGVRQQVCFLLLVVGIAVAQNILALLVGGILGLSAAETLLHGSLVFMGDATLAPLFQQLGGTANLLPELNAVSLLAVLVGTLLGGQVFVALKSKVDLSGTLKPPAPAFTPLDLLRYLFIFALAMAIGFLPSQHGLGQWFSPVGGAFVAGLALRMILDRTKWMEVSLPPVNLLGNVSLSLFLTFVFATLPWQGLHDITLTGVLLVLFNSILLVVVAVYGVGRIMGRNTLATYVAAGLPGFSLGNPASTMATLQCIKENHGALPLAIFIVPPVGAWLINVINPYIIRLFF